MQWHSLCSLQPLPPDSSDSPASAPQVAGTACVAPPYPAHFLVFLVEMGLHNVGQGDLQPLTSSDPRALASQSAGITGLSYHVLTFINASSLNFCLFFCLNRVL